MRRGHRREAGQWSADTAGRGCGLARLRQHEDLLSGQHVSKLARLLLEPCGRLRLDDLTLPVGYLLLQRTVLLVQEGDLRVQLAALRCLAVDAERDDPAESCGYCQPETASGAALSSGCAAVDDEFLAET